MPSSSSEESAQQPDSASFVVGGGFQVVIVFDGTVNINETNKQEIQAIIESIVGQNVEVRVRIETDKQGFIACVVVEVENKETAQTIAKAIRRNSMTTDDDNSGCTLDVLCRAVGAFVTGTDGASLVVCGLHIMFLFMLGAMLVSPHLSQ